jgi:hypothetical protein
MSTPVQDTPTQTDSRKRRRVLDPTTETLDRIALFNLERNDLLDITDGRDMYCSSKLANASYEFTLKEFKFFPQEKSKKGISSFCFPPDAIQLIKNVPVCTGSSTEEAVESFCVLCDYLLETNVVKLILKSSIFWKGEKLVIDNSNVLHAIMAKFYVSQTGPFFVQRHMVKTTTIPVDPDDLKKLTNDKKKLFTSGVYLFQRVFCDIVDRLSDLPGLDAACSIQKLFRSIAGVREHFFTYSQDALFMRACNGAAGNLFGFIKQMNFIPRVWGTRELPTGHSRYDLTKLALEAEKITGIAWGPISYARSKERLESANKRQSTCISGRTNLVSVNFDAMVAELKQQGELPELLLSSGSRATDLICRTVYLPMLYDTAIPFDYDKKMLMTTIGGCKRVISANTKDELKHLEVFVSMNLHRIYEKEIIDELKARVDDIIEADPGIPFVRCMPLLMHDYTDFIKKVQKFKEENHDEEAVKQDLQRIKNQANQLLSTLAQKLNINYQFTLHDLRHLYACTCFYKIALPARLNPVLFVNEKLGHTDGMGYTSTLHYLTFYIE